MDGTPEIFKNVLIFVTVADSEADNEEMVASLVEEAEGIGLVLWYAGSSRAEVQDVSEVSAAEAVEETQPR